MCLNLHPDTALTTTGLKISPIVRRTLQVLCFKHCFGLHLDCSVHVGRSLDTLEHDPWIILTINLHFKNKLTGLIQFGFLGSLLFQGSFLPLDQGMGHLVKHQAHTDLNLESISKEKVESLEMLSLSSFLFFLDLKLVCDLLVSCEYVNWLKVLPSILMEYQNCEFFYLMNLCFARI